MSCLNGYCYSARYAFLDAEVDWGEISLFPVFLAFPNVAPTWPVQRVKTLASKDTFVKLKDDEAAENSKVCAQLAKYTSIMVKPKGRRKLRNLGLLAQRLPKLIYFQEMKYPSDSKTKISVTCKWYRKRKNAYILLQLKRTQGLIAVQFSVEMTQT